MGFTSNAASSSFVVGSFLEGLMKTFPDRMSAAYFVLTAPVNQGLGYRRRQSVRARNFANSCVGSCKSKPTTAKQGLVLFSFVRSSLVQRNKLLVQMRLYRVFVWPLEKK